MNTNYQLQLLREKCDQLGQLAASMAGCREERNDVSAVLNLRSDIRRIFDDLGVQKMHSKHERTLCEVFAAEEAKRQ